MKDKRWTKFTERKIDLFTAYCILLGYTKFFNKQIGFSFKNFLLIYKKGIVYSYRDTKEYEFFLNFLKNKKAKFLIILSKLDRQNKKLKIFLKIKKMSSLTDLELLNLFKSFLAVYLDYFPLFTIPKYYGMVFKESDLSKETKNKLRKLRGTAYYEQIQDQFLPLLFKEIGQRKNIKAKLLFAAFPNELLSLFSEKKVKTNNKILQERNRHCLILVGKNRVQIFSSKKAVMQEKKEIKLENQATSIIQGKVAYRGMAKGRIKKVFSLDDLENVKNKVIITPMTSVRFFPFLGKVKAIVTDEGGIACHAAIISRELKIPCVIGTKIATQVFKDGDLVEVDANQGIVRKLNK
ncbi:MAG: PEP-utilizing enzyme [Patescibacteria group bacterium]